MCTLWKDQEVRLLIKLQQQGKNYKEIAKELKRSYNAIYKMSKKMNLSVSEVGRPSSYQRLTDNSTRQCKRDINKWNKRLKEVFNECERKKTTISNEE
jgi:transposase